jgi:hypothetical protein
MTGLGYQEILIIVALLLPPTLSAIGFTLLAVYTGFLWIRDSFTHTTIHLRHRKAH